MRLSWRGGEGRAGLAAECLALMDNWRLRVLVDTSRRFSSSRFQAARVIKTLLLVQGITPSQLIYMTCFFF